MSKKYLTMADVESLLSSPKKILNVKELATLTGLSISWIYKLCQQGLIPHSRPNCKLIFFDWDRVQSWLLSNAVSSADDIERQATDYVTSKLGKEVADEPVAIKV